MFTQKKITQKIFTQIVTLSFVDLRWAPLYVSLVLAYFKHFKIGLEPLIIALRWYSSVQKAMLLDYLFWL